MAYSAILFSYFFSKSSTASSIKRDFGTRVFFESASRGSTNSFARDVTNRFR